MSILISIEIPIPIVETISVKSNGIYTFHRQPVRLPVINIRENSFVLNRPVD